MEYLIAIILFIAFLSIQLFFAIPTGRAIKKLYNVFPSDFQRMADSEEGKIQISQSYGHGLYNTICRNINSYIEKNSDSIDLDEMKDIAGRITDKEFEEASARIAFPMYIGLMGTYIGIIFGLAVLVWNQHGDNAFETGAIYTFIGGVIIAMITSLAGLICTTLNNHLAAEASSQLESGKDRFFSFLQTEILPLLPSTIAQTLKEELQKSIGALGGTIGTLDTTVKSLNTELKETFTGITREFGDNLSRNLSGIQATVSSLTQTADSYAASMRQQDELLTKLNSASFATILGKISSTVDKCDGISDTINRMETTAEEIVSKQEKSIQSQTALINAQQAMIDNQNAVNENILRLEEGLNDATKNLHQQLNLITLDSQAKLNQLLQEPGTMFEYIKTTLEQFQRIEQFVESVTTDQFSNNASRIEYINAQLRTLQNSDTTIRNYMNAVQDDLDNYLKGQKETITKNAERFVDSWNRLFNEMMATGAENPLVHLQQLAGINEKLDTIKAVVNTARIDSRLFEELTKIQNILQSPKLYSTEYKEPRNRPAGGSTRSSQNSDVFPKNASEIMSFFQNKLGNIFRKKRSK